jgi:thymidine kinase
MAKLYFRHGTVGSAKTLNLLAVAHNYRQQGKKVFLVKPALDVRFGKNSIQSRAGLEKNADLLVEADTQLDYSLFKNVSCILVDEAQFLSKNVINQLRNITVELDVPVICYGLRTDFKSNLFEGSKRLMELADSVEEVKSTCYFCEKKSVMNMKHVNGVATVEGPSIQLGAEELYYPACYRCYTKQIKKAMEEKEPLTTARN